MIKVQEGGGGNVMAKEEVTLMFDDGELIVVGVICGAVEVIVDAKGAGEGGCGDCIIVKVDITGDGFCGYSEARMGPGSVCEGRKRSGGGRRVIVQANADFISKNAEFVDNGHMSRDSKIVLDNGVEGGGGRCGDITTGVVTIGVCGECWGCGSSGIAGVGRGGRRGEPIWGCGEGGGGVGQLWVSPHTGTEPCN